MKNGTVIHFIRKYNNNFYANDVKETATLNFKPVSNL